MITVEAHEIFNCHVQRGTIITFENAIRFSNVDNIARKRLGDLFAFLFRQKFLKMRWEEGVKLCGIVFWEWDRLLAFVFLEERVAQNLYCLFGFFSFADASPHQP